MVWVIIGIVCLVITIAAAGIAYLALPEDVRDYL